MPELKSSPVLHMPQLVLAEEMDSPLPLEYTLVTVQVMGPISVVAVTQRFGNPLRELADLDYLFPLPEDAAITGFDLLVGEHRILGELQEREQARNAYEEAASQGKRTGLFEQRRPNLFAVRLANVRPAETIRATFRYQQRIKFEDDARGGTYGFVFPMGITPRYDSPQHPGEGEGVHAPLARGEQVGVVEIDLSLDAGFPVREVASPSHEIETIRLDDRRFQVRLVGEQIPDHDFVLRYTPAPEQNMAGWTSGEQGSAFFLATIIPPESDLETARLRREFIFVLDRSGSMTGQPIRQARNALRACLRTLNPGDTFSLLLFDNRLEWFQPEPVPVTQDVVDRADAFLGSVEGRGGTEIVEALEAALALPADPARTRYIVFLTDGAVSADARLLEKIRRRVGGARIFTFGIGPSVNRALLNRMAAYGRGRASFLQLDEDIEGAIIRFQDSVSFPALTNLSLKWSGARAWDIYPSLLPDLYAGQPLEICGRLAQTGSAPARLTIRGLRSGQPVEMTLTFPAQAASEPAIERLWARSRVDDLLDQAELDPGSAEKIRAQALSLALQYGLVSALTSFVAIQPSVTDAISGKPIKIHVSQPLPQGLYPAAFGPVVQQQIAFMAAAPMNRTVNAGIPPALAIPADKIASHPAAYSADDRQKSKTFDAFGLARPATMNENRLAGPKAGHDRPADPNDLAAVLRWLARTQNIDGSWQNDMERTAAALLAFVRAGHTTRSGSYRQLMRRAAGWLAANRCDGLGMFVRARALDELALATGDGADRKAAGLARQSLPAARNDIEAAASGQDVPAPPVIGSLDDLRLAGMLRARLVVPPELLDGPDADLAIIWAAAVNPGRA